MWDSDTTLQDAIDFRLVEQLWVTGLETRILIPKSAKVGRSYSKGTRLDSLGLKDKFAADAVPSFGK